MKIGILETGDVPAPLVADHGTYADLYLEMLQRADPKVTIEAWRVLDGVLPQSPDQMDGWLVSGSRHGAYEDHAWIPPLEDFLRACLAARVPVVGICFGHQILAQALGGKVVKSGKGWGLGVHEYELAQMPSWMDASMGALSGVAVHQDQVVELPEGARVLASSGFCPAAALAYGDPEDPDAISFQPHPEFSTAFARDLIAARRGDAFSDEVADAAAETLHQCVDNAIVAEWIVRYLGRARERRAPA